MLAEFVLAVVTVLFLPPIWFFSKTIRMTTLREYFQALSSRSAAGFDLAGSQPDRRMVVQTEAAPERSSC
jgi:hypothetical protein